MLDDVADASPGVADATRVVLFASIASSTRKASAEAEADVSAHVPLIRPPKTFLGQILFTVDASTSVDALAAAILRLTTVEYVHVLLASCALHPKDAPQQRVPPPPSSLPGDGRSSAARARLSHPSIEYPPRDDQREAVNKAVRRPEQLRCRLRALCAVILRGMRTK